MSDEQYGCWVSPPIYHAEDLNDRQKMLWGRIEALSRKEGYCWVGNETFAEEFGVSVRTIRRDIEHMESLGYLDRTYLRDGEGAVDERRIYPARPDWRQTDTHVRGGGDTDVHTPRTQMSGGGTRSTTDTEKGVSPDEGEDDSADPPPADESKRSIREQLGLDFSDEE